MKIQVTFKDPDVASDAISDAFKDLVIEGLTDPEEAALVREHRELEARTFIFGTYMRYQEYITVEFDTEAKTATVVQTK